MAHSITPVARFLRRGSFVILVCMAFSNLTWADAPLPLPRMVSLGSKRVYLRVGPDKTYRALLEFRREGLPVEIFLEYDNWRKIKDHEGSEGWVHKSMLSGKRRVIFLKGTHVLRKSPDDQAPIISHVESDVVGALLKYNKLWCQVEIDGHKGWVKRESVWGLYPHEESSPTKCLVPFLPIFCR